MEQNEQPADQPPTKDVPTYRLPEANVEEPVPSGVGFGPPTRFPFDPTQPLVLVADGEWVAELEWSVVEGRLECTGMALRHKTNGRPITTSLLRDFRLGSQIARWRAEKRATSELWQDLVKDDLISDENLQYANFLRKALKKRRYQPEHFEEVARVYDKAFVRGEHPTKAVQEHFSEIGPSRSTAAKWVMECRRIGLLPPTEKRRPAGNARRKDPSP